MMKYVTSTSKILRRVEPIVKELDEKIEILQEEYETRSVELEEMRAKCNRPYSTHFNPVYSKEYLKLNQAIVERDNLMNIVKMCQFIESCGDSLIELDDETLKKAYLI